MEEKKVTVSVRDSQMDNIKAILLFLVALGHTLDVYKDVWNVNMLSLIHI